MQILPPTRGRTKAAYFVALSAFLAASAASAGTVYKWVDAQGVVHYSQSMPEAQKNAKVLDVRAGIGMAARPVNTLSAAGSEGESTKTPEQQELDATKDQLKAEQEARKKQQCDQLRANIDSLSIGGRIYETMPSGERKYLTGSEIDAKRVKVRDAYTKNCGGVN